LATTSSPHWQNQTIPDGPVRVAIRWRAWPTTIVARRQRFSARHAASAVSIGVDGGACMNGQISSVMRRQSGQIS